MASVKILNFHRLLFSICREAGQETGWADNWQNINQNLHEIFVKAVMELSDFDSYDYLIIDEAQDLMREDFLNVLSDMLNGGISKGEWTICLDIEQSIFEQQYDISSHKKILQAGTHLSLTENLRNTKEVASWTYGLSRVDSSPVSKTTGVSPVIEYFKAVEGDLKKKLAKYINSQLVLLDEANLPASSLVVLLSRKNPYFDVLEKTSEKTLKRMVKFGQKPVAENCFQWGTVQSFKGLESVSIILLGIESLDNQFDRRQLYVGGSRARSMLSIFLQENQSNSVQNALADIMHYLS